jgi:hypothetical protein
MGAKSEPQGFTCEAHDFFIPEGQKEGCPECIAELKARPDAATMDKAARVAELRHLLSTPLTTSFSLVWERVDALVGRGTLTHELAFPDALEAEILSGDQPTDVEIVMKLKNAMGDKPVVVVDSSSGEDYTV